ncbi:MAG: hypothetical protein IBJ10_08150 [Phycisphaerales bacterium]|nr:hypothetical protein [Phycisphaerales bacterium]
MNPRPVLIAFVSVGALVGMCGCGSSSGSSHSPYANHGESARDPERARQLQAEASALSRSKGPAADAEVERLLRDALAADLYCGPAHNNLGVLLLRKGRVYEAAEEFEWARKLMPGHPDPRVNLALALETAGREREAIDAYDAALAVYEGYLPALQGKARLQVATGRTDDETAAALDEIALRGTEPWRDWALVWKAKLTERQ